MLLFFTCILFHRRIIVTLFLWFCSKSTQLIEPFLRFPTFTSLHESSSWNFWHRIWFGQYIVQVSQFQRDLGLHLKWWASWDLKGRRYPLADESLLESLRLSLNLLGQDWSQHHRRTDFLLLIQRRPPPNTTYIGRHLRHFLVSALSSFWVLWVFDHCQLDPNRPHHRTTLIPFASSLSSSFFTSSCVFWTSFLSNRLRSTLRDTCPNIPLTSPRHLRWNRFRSYRCHLPRLLPKRLIAITRPYANLFASYARLFSLDS